MMTAYTQTLRTKLSKYMSDNACSFYRIQKATGVHRQTIKGFLNGSELYYETGMKLRKFMRDYQKQQEDNGTEPKEHKPTCIHFPCTCEEGE